MTQDMELAARIEQEGSWEQAKREAQAATIARNVARWRMEHEKKQRKDAQLCIDYRLKPGRQLREFKAKKRMEQKEKYLLKSCRATLGEIVSTHQKQHQK